MNRKADKFQWWWWHDDGNDGDGDDIDIIVIGEKTDRRPNVLNALHMMPHSALTAVLIFPHSRVEEISGVDNCVA